MNSVTEQIFIVNASDTLTAVPKIGEPDSSTQANADFSTVCRTCAMVTEFVIPIFDGEGLQNNLADKIHKHLPIQVSVQDPLPLVVCYQCASTLLAWHELVQCCAQADAALRARLPSQESKLNSTNAIQNSEQEQQQKSRTEFSSMLKNVLVEYLPSHSAACEDLDYEYVCQQCPASLSSVDALADHLLAAHAAAAGRDALKQFINNNVTFEEMLFSDDSDRDVASETTDNRMVLPNFLCPYCESIFSSTTRLIYHLNRHAEASMEDGMVCCETTYNDKKSFVQHLQEEHVQRPADGVGGAVCRSCGFKAPNPQSLHKHVTEAHDVKKPNRTKQKAEPSPKNQKYIAAVCPECNKCFSNKYNMFVHMKQHSATGATFPCDKCKKSFTSRGNLEQHTKLAHGGVLRFLCLFCGEAFGSRLARDVHSRRHSGAAPYACKYCRKAFRAKNSLDRHHDMHLDVRKYDCHLCPKKFRKSSHLKYHVESHGRKSK